MKTSLNLLKNLNESTMPEIKKTVKLKEGAGAGYNIMGTIENAQVNSFSIVETTEDDYGIPTYVLDCDITADFTDVSFESYYYGSKVDMANIHITKLCLTDNHEPEDKKELDEYSIKESLNGTEVKSLIGSGWIHQTFTGSIEFNDDNAAGSSYTDFYVSGVGYNFTDEELVNYIDSVVTGDNIYYEYIVYGANYDELERFDSEEEAIEYAKNNPEAVKVEELSYNYTYDDNIDPNSEYSDVIWRREDYEESESIDNVNRLNETTNIELERRKEDLRARERQALVDIGDSDPDSLLGIAKRLPSKIWLPLEKESAELDCIGMIHSILTYSEPDSWTTENVLSNRYMLDYIKELGKEKVTELINQEIEEYKNNAIINKDVHTDAEGVSYNSVTFKNESEDTNLNESERLIEEEKVTDNLQEVKSQGNIFMLQDGESKYIVGENYNSNEKLIENAEIYETKEDADKDYFSRCEIKLDDKEVDPTNIDLVKPE